MNCETKEQSGAMVVILSGDVDLGNSPTVRAALLECVEKNRPVVVDLAAVNYIDSSGIASLVEAFQLARKSSSGFALAAISENAMRVLKLARLDQVFTIHEDVPSAISALS